MKKSVLSISVLLLAQSAMAWSISIGPIKAKGDDPQIIKDAGKVIGKAGTEVANGVRDVFSAVGNATGITDVLDSNTETFVNIGRGYACMATLCYSEELRKKQIEQAEDEAAKAYEAYVQKAVNEYSSMNAQERYDIASKLKDTSAKKYLLIADRFEILRKENDILRSFLTAISQEAVFRKKLIENKLPTRPLKDREMIPATETFVKNYKKDYNQALTVLNSQINSIAQSTKRSNSKLMAEFIRILELENLVDLSKMATEAFNANKDELRLTQEELVQAHADFKANEEAFLQGKF